MTLCFTKGIAVYVDADLGGDLDNSKSQIGLCLHVDRYGSKLDVEVAKICGTFYNRGRVHGY